MLFGGAATARMPDTWPNLFSGTTTELTVYDVRPLAEGLVVVEATQSVGPLPPPHITAVVGQAGESAEILECRPYAFLTLP